MTAEQKKQLQQKLWDIANELRGKMAADQFRDYILGLIFYKYLSERMHAHANRILGEKYPSFTKIAGHEQEEKLKQAVKTSALKVLGYYLAPEELFSELASRGARDEFILSDLERVLNHIQDSTMGTDSEQDFVGLFEDVDLGHPKLGRTEEQKNELIAKVIVHLQQIDFGMNGDDSHANEELLGDAYEYLIGQFASGAGKKAGEFYTPASVSTVLAKIVTLGKDSVGSVYDPTCGSGSLLLRVAREVSGETRPKFFGQEMNRTTFNLARMNMLLHGIHFSDFDIRQEDTLTRPAPEHEDMQFEAIVANPPFSAKWSAHEVFNSDDRYSQYGRLAPKSKADFAFVQHMLHHLDENGTMAVILPHGVLFRGAAEAHIRKYIIKDRNWLDAVIGLPANVFYGTSIPTTILVFKKCREDQDHIMFVDASKQYENAKTKNALCPEHIDAIIDTYANRKTVDKLAYRAPLSEIAENDYNLNIPRYVDTFETEPEVNLMAVRNNSVVLQKRETEALKLIESLCDGIGISAPVCNNIDIWITFKRGLMQGLFSQTLRFKNDDGIDYPEWGNLPLRKLVQRSTKKNEDYSINRVLSNSAKNGIVDQTGYFDRTITTADNLDGYYVVEEGDFVYNPRVSISAPVGPIGRNKLGVGVMSPLYTVFRPDENIADFLEAYFMSQSWTEYVFRVSNVGARHDRMNITTGDFFEMPIPLPSPEEQRKISDIIFAVDSKIDAISKVVEKTHEFKQGAIQDMFL